jgi:hypothetical protein
MHGTKATLEQFGGIAFGQELESLLRECFVHPSHDCSAAALHGKASLKQDIFNTELSSI